MVAGHVPQQGRFVQQRQMPLRRQAAVGSVVQQQFQQRGAQIPLAAGAQRADRTGAPPRPHVGLRRLGLRSPGEPHAQLRRVVQRRHAGEQRCVGQAGQLRQRPRASTAASECGNWPLLGT